jgi:hypothetical protein
VLILSTGGGIFYKLGRILQRLEIQAAAIDGVNQRNADLAAKIIVSGPDAPNALRKALAIPVRSPAAIRDVAAVIDEAAAQKIEVPREVIAAAGSSLIAAPKSTGDPAWTSLLKLARYRSILNEQHAPSQTLALPVESKEFPNWDIEDPHWRSFVRLIGKVPFDKSSRLEALDKPNGSNSGYGPE